MNNKLLTQKQELEKKKMIIEMEKEIQTLKDDLKHSRTKNIKIHTLRILNYSLKVTKILIPYFISAEMTFGILSLMGNTPFIRDNEKQKLEIKKEIDSKGNVRYEKQYSEFEDAIGSISYIGKWYKEKDGFYLREIKTYLTNEVSEDIITKIINNLEINSLDNVFGSPKSKKIETKNNLTDEEIESKPYLQAVVYSKVDDDFIIVKQSISNNIAETALYFLVNLIFTFLILNVKENTVGVMSLNKYKEFIEEIKEKYPLIDIDELMTKIEIRESNYNRLTR